MEENSKKNYGNPADVMLLLAKEAEDVVASAGKSAQQQAEEETRKLLLQYEQRAKQIVLKIREESRARADEMAARFREALILRVEEASTAAMYETINSVGASTAEIVKHLQESVKKETRQALAEGLVAGDGKADSKPVHAEANETVSAPESVIAEGPEAPPEAVESAAGAPEEFGKWLMQ
jgi:hypothetical protein